MGTNRQEQANRTKQKIMETAGRLLAEKDMESVTIRDIASECGIALGTMYHYFKSKEELVCFMNQKRYEDRFEEIMSLSNASPLENFYTFIDTWFDYVSHDNINYSRQWFILAFQGKIPPNRNGQNRLEEDISYLTSFLSQAVKGGILSASTPVDVIAKDLVFSMYGAAVDYYLSTEGFDFLAWGEYFLRNTIPMHLKPYRIDFTE